MNLDGLRQEGAKRMKRAERACAFDVLGMELARADRRRYRCLSKIEVSVYLSSGETVRVHRSLLPPTDDRYSGPGLRHEPLHWEEWTSLTVDRVGATVRLFVPGHGSMAWAAGTFVQAVISGRVLEAQ